MAHWSLNDIAWREFDCRLVTPDLLSLTKAACLVEYNAYDYARYLREVFSDDKVFQQAALDWAAEEVQHGMALRKWAELADPGFDFAASFKTFTNGYQLPAHVRTSVRGSRAGELIARCIVEIGTSFHYTAIKDYTQEPVLKALCGKIAADEFRHYKMFYTHLQRYLASERLSPTERVRVAVGRIAESEDDELAYAFYAAHRQGASSCYNRKICASRYFSCTSMLHRKEYIERMTAMVFKAVGFAPHVLFNKILSRLIWEIMKWKAA